MKRKWQISLVLVLVAGWTASFALHQALAQSGGGQKGGRSAPVKRNLKIELEQAQKQVEELQQKLKESGESKASERADLQRKLDQANSARTAAEQKLEAELAKTNPTPVQADVFKICPNAKLADLPQGYLNGLQVRFIKDTEYRWEELGASGYKNELNVSTNSGLSTIELSDEAVSAADRDRLRRFVISSNRVFKVRTLTGNGWGVSIDDPAGTISGIHQQRNKYDDRILENVRTSAQLRLKLKILGLEVVSKLVDECPPPKAAKRSKGVKGVPNGSEKPEMGTAGELGA